jgi:hypothetical protein
MGKALASRGAAPRVMGDGGTAADRVGQVVTVEGVVLRATRTAPGGRGYVLTLSPPRSDCEIQVWIMPQAIPRMGPPMALEGRRIRVTGAVWKHDGVAPAMTVADATQLTAIRREVAGPVLAR